MTSLIHTNEVAEIDPSAWLLIVTHANARGYHLNCIPEGLAAAQLHGTSYSRQSKSMIVTQTGGAMHSLYTDVKGISPTSTLPIGTLLRDLGKRIDFIINGNLAIRWRQVQRVSNIETGGVSGDVFYVATFISNFAYFADMVYVTRTGSTPERSVNSQYFVAFQDISGYVAPLVNSTTLPPHSAGILIHRGDFLRDIGKSIDFNMDGKLAVRWQLVQRMAGATTEGDNLIGAERLYVATFVSDSVALSDRVGVVRTGTSIHNSLEQTYFTRCLSTYSDPTVVGGIYAPSSLTTGLAAARTAGVSFVQDGMRVNTPSLAAFNSLYTTYIKPTHVALSSATLPFMFKDMGKNIDFTIVGKLAIRWRLMQVMLGAATEGDDSIIYSPHQVVYIPIYVSDVVKLGELVFVGRVG